jgi:hypothetical protein
MFLAGRKPDDITRTNFFDGSTPVLRPAIAGSDDECLAERVRMPCGTCARFEGDVRTDHTRRFGRREKRIDAYSAREPVCWAFS